MEADLTLDGGLVALLDSPQRLVYLCEGRCSIGLEVEVWNENHQAKHCEQSVGVSHG